MAENTYNGAVLAQSWKQVFKLWDQSGAKDARSKYIDFPYIFALVKTKLACGKGYSFNSEDPKTSELFKKLELDSRFQEKINLLLYNIYYYGIAYGGFDRLANDEYRMYAINQQVFRPYITKAYEDVIGFVFLKETTISTAYKLITRETWTLKEIQRQYWYNKEEVSTMGIPTEVPKEYILPEKEANPFEEDGIIPFQDFPNYTFSDKPDWYPLRNYFFLLNQKIQHLEREIKMNRSRLVLNLTPSQKKTMEDNAENNKFFDDYLISADTTNESSKMAESIPSTLLISQLTEAISSQIKEIFSLSGLSYYNTIENPQTATEVGASQSGLTNTIISSQRAFNENMSKLLTKYFKVNGIEKPDFSFHLNENTAVDQTTILNETMIALNNGLITKAKASSIIFNQPESEAEIEVKSATKEQDEMKQKEMEMFQEQGGENPMNNSAGGKKPSNSGTDGAKMNTTPSGNIVPTKT